MSIFIVHVELLSLNAPPYSKAITNNKLDPHMASPPGVNPGPNGGRRVLSTMDHPCPPRGMRKGQRRSSDSNNMTPDT